ncbi:predicted protein [Plenodomus lingam JN3]|uniref:Predicted protein n=2 Tax=Leptosphaeria maculans TaxID=5022 RepID=E4ZMA3_LEPMJ|nr:predicted protein [Plenodomus lingam JN3]CBX92452.1 predicted protein [Plenodomus lingam JN3]
MTTAGLSKKVEWCSTIFSLASQGRQIACGVGYQISPVIDSRTIEAMKKCPCAEERPAPNEMMGPEGGVAGTDTYYRIDDCHVSLLVSNSRQSRGTARAMRWRAANISDDGRTMAHSPEAEFLIMLQGYGWMETRASLP